MASSNFFGHEVERRAVAQSTSAVVCLTGFRGSGKTSLIRAVLADELRGQETYLASAHDIDAYDDESLAIENALERGLLVVVDDAESLSQLEINSFVRKAGVNKGRLFLVGQHLPSIPAAERVEMNSLTLEQSIRMLHARAGKSISNERIDRLVHVYRNQPAELAALVRLLEIEATNTQSSFFEQVVYESPVSELPSEDVSGIIVPATNAVIEALKRSPHDIHKLRPRQFEELIADLLAGMGWEPHLTQQTRDGGMDILAYLTTPLGRLLCIVEAKHYRPDRPVGVDLLRGLYGSLKDIEASSSILVTSSYFTKDAKIFQEKHRHVMNLRDYTGVVDWIQKHK